MKYASVKTLTTLLASLLAMSTLSCSASKSSATLTFGNTEVPLIDASTSSCSAVAAFLGAAAGGTAASADVSSHYFQLQLPQIHWTDTSKVFVVSYIAIEFQDPDIAPQKCIIAGNEMQALFAKTSGGTTYTPWTDYTLPAATADENGVVTESKRDSWSECRQLSCGGFSVRGASGRSFAGIAKIVGYSQDKSLKDEPVSSTTPITVTFTND